MRILFAAPDRDLLECYKTILEADFGETVTAFDGTQVISLLSTERFDVVILDCHIPRVEYKTLVARIGQKNIPIIVLTDEPVSAQQLTQEELPNAFLSYPFDSKALCGAVRGVFQTASSDSSLRFGDIEIDLSGFRIKDGSKLTANEINVLQGVLCKKTVSTHDGACISALNTKFARAGSQTRIQYRTKKGFVLVTENE